MAFGIAIFPFLKTSRRIRLGPVEFRSTDDVSDLSDAERTAVIDIKNMLFLKDDLKIISATYSLIDVVDIDQRKAQNSLLADIRAVVAYAYSAPHHLFGNVFLHPEDISMVTLSPGDVSVHLVFPHHHVIPTEESLQRRPVADKFGMIPGYVGMYNFVEPMWVSAGSRIYPPRPQAVLNIQQDIANDFEAAILHGGGTAQLLRMLAQPTHSSRDRVFTALRWYNHANESLAGPDREILSLAVAFEALFNLPENSKSDRLADAVSLILGRTERIYEWATQFYAARSQVAHEGVARETFFRPSAGKRDAAEERFGTLMSSGRKIFQLCLMTLLTGVAHADEAGLSEALVSNTERYTRICTVLQQGGQAPIEALAAVAPTVRQIERHRYVNASPVGIDLMLGALRLACTALMDCGFDQPPDLLQALSLCAAPEPKASQFDRLDALFKLTEEIKAVSADLLRDEQRTVHLLAEEVWHVTFTTYFAMKRAAGT